MFSTLLFLISKTRVQPQYSGSELWDLTPPKGGLVF